MNASPVGRPDGCPRYEIRLKGRLDSGWPAWFDGLSLSTDDDGTTALRGVVVDQAALHGLLQSLRDLGLPLVSVTPQEHDGAQPTSHHPNSGTPSRPAGVPAQEEPR